MFIDAALALLTLTAMEIVLGIDNVIFIAIVAARLPLEKQPKARRLGLIVALLTRLVLLGLLFWLTKLDKVAVFSLTGLGIPERWVNEEVDVVSVKDLVLLVGGMFLIGKSVMEIHHKLEGDEETQSGGAGVSFIGILVQIALLDIVFSLDSVITAVGMAREIWVMVVAMILAMGVMFIFADTVSNFVSRHPTVKILALAFLILIGVMLVAEGTGQHISKGYIYFAMAFSVVVEMLNLRLRARTPPVHLHEKRLPGEASGGA